MTTPDALHSSLRSPNVIRFFIVLAAFGLTIWSQCLPRTSSFIGDEFLRDRFIRLHASSTPENRIAIIDIDEASLLSTGPWPWPRSRIADIVEKLVTVYEARSIALDLVFPDPADSNGDLRLATLGQYGPLVLAEAFDYEPRQVPVQVGTVSGGIPATSAMRNAPVATGYIANHTGLSKANNFGNIGFKPDVDGNLRRLAPWTRYGDRAYPALSIALLDCCTTKHTADVNEGWVRIPYSRNWSAYTVVSAAAILNQSAPVDIVRGRLVIIGSSSLGLTDRVSTPLHPSTSGVLVHASQLTSLLDQQEGKAPKPWPGRFIAILYALVLSAVAAYALPRLSAAINVALLAGASIIWIFLAYWLAQHDPVMATTGPLATAAFLIGVAVPFDWQMTQSRSRKLLYTFRHYVAEAVVDELMRGNLEDPLAPQQLDVTTLIADMQGYTQQVEALSMAEAAELTRDFLDCLTRPVLHQRGTLDKFTGDGLVCFWGAPLPVSDHADFALDAACDIVREVKRFSEKRQQAGLAPLRVRIGIESGQAMAGNFGTSFRSIYTAVGDSVNVAARLEQAARDYPYSIIVGKGTVERSKRHRFIYLGDTVLRGKEKPTSLYTLDPSELEASA